MDAQTSDAIALDAESFWVKFTIGDVAFECEIYETNDLLAAIDIKHRRDHSSCLDCSHTWEPTDDEYGRAELALCPNCGANNQRPEASEENPNPVYRPRVRPAQEYLDDVSALLRERFGVKRCGRTEAAKFYATICRKCEEQKKSTI